MPFLPSLFRPSGTSSSGRTAQLVTPSLTSSSPSSAAASPSPQRPSPSSSSPSKPPPPPTSFKYAPPAITSKSSTSSATPITASRVPSPSTASSASPARVTRSRSGSAGSTSHAPPPKPPPKHALPPTPHTLPRRADSASAAGTTATRAQPPPGQGVTLHHGQASVGSPSASAPPPSAQRSRTSSNPSFPTLSSVIRPTLPRSVTQPVQQASTAPSPTTPTTPHGPSARAASDTTPKRRPVALKLKTSNLTPPHSPRAQTSISSAVETLVTPTKLSSKPAPPFLRRAESADDISHPDTLLARQKKERRRSRSLGNVAQRAAAALALSQQHNHSQPPTSSNSSSPMKRELRTPLSALVETPTSGASQPAPQPALTKGKALDNVPLPWSLIPAATLRSSLGSPSLSSLVSQTLTHLPSTPHLLPPHLIRTTSSEELRLRAELQRLRQKYANLLAQRDTLLERLEGVSMEAGPDPRLVQAVIKASGRCDRIARQVFICNDQIRQIEGHRREHEAGCLRVRLAELEARLEGEESETSSLGTVTPGCGGTYRQDKLADAQEEKEEKEGAPDRDEAGEERPVAAGIARYSTCPRSSHVHLETRPISTATLISVNRLSFPLPPDRFEPLSLDGPTSASFTATRHHAHARSQSADEATNPPHDHRTQLEVEVELEPFEEGCQIFILPPSGHNHHHHRRSTSCPTLTGGSQRESLDMPRTAWRSDETHFCSSVSVLPRAEPRGTAPLRVKQALVRKRGMGKARSLAVKRQSNEHTRRARRGRESQLETPESIMLSLATAGLWTRKGMLGREDEDEYDDDSSAPAVI